MRETCQREKNHQQRFDLPFFHFPSSNRFFKREVFLLFALFSFASFSQNATEKKRARPP